ncbi:hypothetical protein [Lactobacillus helsingborgensis]|uniref:hypothetical protein n=1 Tax=Lactobacillus helsingborgensis TaxID=1218494 RepID=UPI002264D513|nr:hypothetical protein [Lactobacillus helsingborgensis]UZX32397.1 hypothetical protein LDX52_09495 [Lactobacillus helsingborgensis]
MNISKNVSVTSSTLAALGGITVIAHTPSFSIIAHADETHAQDTEKDPSVGDNNVQDSTQVSTIDDAYNDIKGDMEHDTNPSQHISIPFEYDTPAHAAQSWEHRKDTEIEPGTENTQTDWNIATGTNGHAASDTSANVTGDSSENKFNPGNRINYLGDKSGSVRENWVQIEKNNQAYDDFINGYGPYWGPIYWSWYCGGYYPSPSPLGTTIIDNNNNNDNVINNAVFSREKIKKDKTSNYCYQNGTNLSNLSHQKELTLNFSQLPSSFDGKNKIFNSLGRQLPSENSGIVTDRNEELVPKSCKDNKSLSEQINSHNDSETYTDKDYDKEGSNNNLPNISGLADNSLGSTNNSLPQTGNIEKVQKSSVLGAGLITTTLFSMGLTKINNLKGD